MTNYWPKLAFELGSIMENKHLNQADMARRLGVKRQTVGDLLGGETTPSIERVVTFCHALGVSPAWLLAKPEERDALENMDSNQDKIRLRKLILTIESLDAPNDSALGALEAAVEGVAAACRQNREASATLPQKKKKPAL